MSEILNIPIKRNESNGSFELDMTTLSEENLPLLDEIISNPEETINKIKGSSVLYNEIRLINIPNTLTKQISTLRSKDVGSLIKLNGTLKKIILPTPKIESIKFECASCGSVMSVKQDKNKLREPPRCSCGRRGGFSKVSEVLIDIQEMELEENSEDVGSKQPQKVRLFLENGLTDPTFSKFQVGNKVEVIGVYKRMPLFVSRKDFEYTVPDYMVQVINITPKEGYEEDIKITEEEEKQIREISVNNPLEILSNNIAPNLIGLEYIKKSIVLFLAKGVTKNIGLERDRGEIHILTLGDAGLGKSKMAENIKNRVINCRVADGKNASKAGIIATVSKDKNTEKWGVEAGDIVLANKGYLIIDEADKLSPTDREALHGPMESGFVDISKAGVNAHMSANTSILAFANPKGGKVDKKRAIIEQIDFTPTLLSRFDLIFVLVDKPNAKEDKKMSDLILNSTLEENKGFSPEFIKKYFHYISKLKPKLTKETADIIGDFYTRIRSLSVKDGEFIGIPITKRSLKGLLRLSEAHAKLRLSEIIEKEDVEVAKELFTISLSNFGVSLEEGGSVDMSSITTKIKMSKKDKYYEILTYLKQKAKENNEFKKDELITELQKKLNMSYKDIYEIIELLHSERETIENNNIIKLVNID